MSLEPIFDGVRRFQREAFPRRRSLFTELAGGQHPEVLLVTCSDSRIDPSLVTQTEPGDLFIVRNAGNIVPPASDGPGGESATIEYGVQALGVKHIVVCGHTKCGAMAALRDPASAEGLPNVVGWLEHGKPALDKKATLADGGDDLSNTVAANVLAQIDHLKTHPAVRDAVDRGDLSLHGWVYDIEHGELHVYDGDRFQPLGAEEASRGAATEGA